MGVIKLTIQWNFASLYVDHIVIVLNSAKARFRHMWHVLKLLHDYGVTIDFRKWGLLQYFEISRSHHWTRTPESIATKNRHDSHFDPPCWHYETEVFPGVSQFPSAYHALCLRNCSASKARTAKTWTHQFGDIPWGWVALPTYASKEADSLPWFYMLEPKDPYTLGSMTSTADFAALSFNERLQEQMSQWIICLGHLATLNKPTILCQWNVWWWFQLYCY